VKQLTPRAVTSTLIYAIDTDLRLAGLDPLTFRYTTLIDGITTDGEPFTLSFTEGEDVEAGRETRSELLALFAPGGAA
jgi:hypothetical protein